MKTLILILCIYVISAHLFSRNFYKFCKKNKECRNINCVKAQECKFNSLYNNNRN